MLFSLAVPKVAVASVIWRPCCLIHSLVSGKDVKTDAPANTSSCGETALVFTIHKFMLGTSIVISKLKGANAYLMCR